MPDNCLNPGAQPITGPVARWPTKEAPGSGTMAVDMAAMNDLIAVRLFMVKKRNRRENPLGYALLGQRDVGGGAVYWGQQLGGCFRRFRLIKVLYCIE
jgi:hypothetical protein